MDDRVRAPRGTASAEAATGIAIEDWTTEPRAVARAEAAEDTESDAGAIAPRDAADPRAATDVRTTVSGMNWTSGAYGCRPPINRGGDLRKIGMEG